MRRMRVAAMAAIAGFWSTSAFAVTEQDFTLQTAQDLVDVCSVDTGNPMYVASIHFCHGFVTGTSHYHRALASGPRINPLFCPPEPRPTRDQAIAMFLTWASGQDLTNETAVDGLMRFAIERWPCE